MEWGGYLVGVLGVLYFLSAIANGIADNIQQNKDIKVVLEGIKDELENITRNTKDI